MNLRQRILDLLDEGPTYPYAIYRRLRDNGYKARYGTVRWQVLFLTREGLIRPLPRGEAEFLGLQLTPDRSRRSGKKPPMDRQYYKIA